MMTTAVFRLNIGDPGLMFAKKRKPAARTPSPKDPGIEQGHVTFSEMEGVKLAFWSRCVTGDCRYCRALPSNKVTFQTRLGQSDARTTFHRLTSPPSPQIVPSAPRAQFASSTHHRFARTSKGLLRMSNSSPWPIASAHTTAGHPNLGILVSGGVPCIDQHSPTTGETGGSLILWN